MPFSRPVMLRTYNFIGSAAFSTKPPKNARPEPTSENQGIKETYTAEEFEQFLDSQVDSYKNVFGGTDLDKHLDQLIEKKLQSGMSDDQILEEITAKIPQMQGNFESDEKQEINPEDL